MTKPERNIRAVELWLQSNSWRTIASRLSAEGFGAVSHQYVARIVKRELTRAWRGAAYSGMNPAVDSAVISGGSSGLRPFSLHARLSHAPAQAHAPEATALQQAPAPAVTDAREKPETTTTEIIVESFFNARHFVTMNGSTGVPHNHSYRAQLVATGAIDSANGIIIGFAEAQAILDGVLAQFGEELLNRLELFSEGQPTAEKLALTIVDLVKNQLAAAGVRVASVTLWESPTKGVTVTPNPANTGLQPEITEAGDQPFISS